MIGYLRVILKLILFVLISVPLPLTQMVVLQFTRGPRAYIIPQLWHRSLCWAFGMDLKVTGTPLPTTAPVMFISNHTSYLDILVMGSFLRASFVAKNDVANWPIFGFLSKLQQTAFISRSAHHALREKYSLQSYLKAGKSIILYPEGTTNDGQNMLPFKSSLFALALEHELTGGKLMIQPFSLVIHPRPHDPSGATAYPWAFFDETPMATHLLRFARSSGCTLELIFHTPVDPKKFTDRKDLCRTVQEMVANGMKTGQPQPILTIQQGNPTHEL
jgi:lyso-ornithine lipid O-acyltransferase